MRAPPSKYCCDSFLTKRLGVSIPPLLICTGADVMIAPASLEVVVEGTDAVEVVDVEDVADTSAAVVADVVDLDADDVAAAPVEAAGFES